MNKTQFVSRALDVISGTDMRDSVLQYNHLKNLRPEGIAESMKAARAAKFES